MEIHPIMLILFKDIKGRKAWIIIIKKNEFHLIIQLKIKVGILVTTSIKKIKKKTIFFLPTILYVFIIFVTIINYHDIQIEKEW